MTPSMELASVALPAVAFDRGVFGSTPGCRSPLRNGRRSPACLRDVMKRREHAGHAARRQLRRDRSSDQRRTPGRRGTDHAPARGPDPEFSWTPTGISVSIDGLTIDADHATNSQYGQRALVSIRAGDRLCYRQRLNLEDPHQRQTFIAKLVLSCEQAGMMDVLTLVKHRVTPRLLIELGDACRRRRAKPLTDPHAEQAQRTAAEQRAGSLLDDPTILSRVGEAMRANGYAGKLEPAQLAYVALTSRLLEERPINLELLGDPAAGKNATIDAALALIPRDGVSQGSPDPCSVPEPSATKLPPPAGGS